MAQPTPSRTPLASSGDYQTFRASEEGQRVIADLKDKFEFHLCLYRTDEILTNSEGSETLAKLRDGNHEVIKHLLQS